MSVETRASYATPISPFLREAEFEGIAQNEAAPLGEFESPFVAARLHAGEEEAEAAAASPEMLTLRRFGWNLAREEFFSVALMAWFEYTLSGNTEIVRVLRAEAGSPSARLAKVAARVGMAIPRMTDEYFQMAVPLSGTMQAIESGQFNGITTASTFYRSAGLRQDLLTIIDNWSRATGHDIKSTRVQLSRA